MRIAHGIVQWDVQDVCFSKCDFAPRRQQRCLSVCFLQLTGGRPCIEWLLISRRLVVLQHYMYCQTVSSCFATGSRACTIVPALCKWCSDSCHDSDTMYEVVPRSCATNTDDWHWYLTQAQWDVPNATMNRERRWQIRSMQWIGYGNGSSRLFYIRCSLPICVFASTGIWWHSDRVTMCLGMVKQQWWSVWVSRGQWGSVGVSSQWTIVMVMGIRYYNGRQLSLRTNNVVIIYCLYFTFTTVLAGR